MPVALSYPLPIFVRALSKTIRCWLPMFVKFHLPIDAVNATDEYGCGCPKIRNEHNALSGHNSE